MIYDAAIIGTGPAGLSAALNLKIHEKTFLWLGSRRLSDKVGRAERIANYPGFSGVTGAELNAAFRRQAEEMGLEIVESMVSSILDMGGRYALTAGGEFYETKALVLATGVNAVGTLPGESALVGRGVSYCATCDGALYRRKTIAVLCNNARFEHEVEYLADLAGKVYFFPTYPGASGIRENVERMQARAVRIEGEKRASGVTLNSGETLAVDGVFCLRDAISLGTLLPGLAAQGGHIQVDRRMATNLPGVFAAGDCTGRPYQYTKAVGEGNVAAHSVIGYLAALEKAGGAEGRTAEN